MGLTEDSKQYLNKNVKVIPFYGWGWNKLDDPKEPDLTYEEMAGPPPFHMLITEFFEDQGSGSLRGGRGTIKESGHKYDNFRVVFSTRHIGTYDLISKIGQYNIEIAPEDASGKWPSVTGVPHLYGYAEIKL